MLHASTQQLIAKLCELTDKGQIAWKEGERKCSVFETEGYVVEVEPEPPTVRLLRSDGAELERADAADLAATPWAGGDGTYATQVAEMARRANRVARGAEAAISKILSSLSAPRQKALEPEPLSASLEFDQLQPVKRPVSAAESAAAMAAVTADMDARRKASEPPPVSHSAPETPPKPIESIEADTAIERVLAVQPASHPAPPEPLVEAPKPVEAKVEPPKPDPRPDPRPEPRPQPVLTVPEPAPGSVPLPVIAPPQPRPVIAATPPPAPQPPPVKAEPRPAPRSVSPLFAPEPKPSKPAFGSTESFAQASASQTPIDNPPPKPQAAAPAPAAPVPTPSKVTSTGLLFGYSARTRQTTLGAPPAGTSPRPAAAIAAPPTAPAPAPQPEEPARPAATGADVYKPWS